VNAKVVHPRGYNKKANRPPANDILKSFAELGTQKEVARRYDVSRATVWKWQQQLGLNVQYHPEIPRAQLMTSYLSNQVDRVRLAQWICDEGTVSASYDLKNDNTYLVVGGSMTDSFVLEEIGRVTHERVSNETRTPTFGWMPMRYVRLYSAEAYALLVCIHDELLGLKRYEAEAALKFFPPCGYLHGRHSTDEFLKEAWRLYAEGVVRQWNGSRQKPISQAEMTRMVETWIELRVKRARYFRDRPNDTKTK
jgi:hypothetical protein